jgi:flavin reductase (DIM6/NTAB) family NADH-FMN oxidoreductase RutF
MTKALRPQAAVDSPDEAGPEPTPPVVLPHDRALYREGMSRIAAAVNLITTDGPAGLAGFTATAMTSVSDDPPTLLVCMHISAQSRPRLLANGVFCVNTLAASGAGLADIFAGRTGKHLDQRFEHGVWERLVTGSPVLQDAAVAFDCRLLDVKDVSTHHVLFGEVVSVRLGGQVESLAWLHRGYRTLT